MFPGKDRDWPGGRKTAGTYDRLVKAVCESNFNDDAFHGKRSTSG